MWIRVKRRGSDNVGKDFFFFNFKDLFKGILKAYLVVCGLYLHKTEEKNLKHLP